MDFEFFLASELRMTVADLRGRMSQAEFVQWHAWYGLRNSRERLAAKSAG